MTILTYGICSLHTTTSSTSPQSAKHKQSYRLDHFDSYAEHHSYVETTPPLSQLRIQVHSDVYKSFAIKMVNQNSVRSLEFRGYQRHSLLRYYWGRTWPTKLNAIGTSKLRPVSVYSIYFTFNILTADAGWLTDWLTDSSCMTCVSKFDCGQIIWWNSSLLRP